MIGSAGVHALVDARVLEYRRERGESHTGVASAVKEHFVEEVVPRPVQLSIPSINLSAPVIEVGIDKEGRMDVPNGKTPNVGWYQYGPSPGEMGSAVISAHVYAAFSNLDHVRVGDGITVHTESGMPLRFVVSEVTTYPLEDLSPEVLFNKNDARRLTLITCAGKPVPGTDTYDKRLVVYATLVS